MKNYRKTNHRVYSLQMHVVLCIKYRKRIISDSVMAAMKGALHFIEGTSDVQFRAFNHDGDHVHFIVDYSQDDTPGKVVTKIKSIMAKWVWQYNESELLQVFRNERVFWSGGAYFRSVGEGDIEDVRAYIERQGE